MKILITGGSGLLGSRLCKLFSKEFDVYATYTRNKINIKECKFFAVDVTDILKISTLIKKITPEIIVHAAALTDVDYCENHQKEAWKINVEGTKNIINTCKEIEARLIFISTDYVFDGIKGDYSEDDGINPLNYYAKTKAEGERMLKESNLEYAIARASVIYGWNGPGQRLNFVTWVIDSLKEGKTINVVDDQYNTPTFADNGAEALYSIVSKEAYGVYHMTGRECINRYEFAKKIADAFNLDKSNIILAKTLQLRQSAKRPYNSCLLTSKIERELKHNPFTINEGLKAMKRQKNYKGWLNG